MCGDCARHTAKVSRKTMNSVANLHLYTHTHRRPNDIPNTPGCSLLFVSLAVGIFSPRRQGVQSLAHLCIRGFHGRLSSSGGRTWRNRSGARRGALARVYVCLLGIEASFCKCGGHLLPRFEHEDGIVAGKAHLESRAYSRCCRATRALPRGSRALLPPCCVRARCGGAHARRWTRGRQAHATHGCLPAARQGTKPVHGESLTVLAREGSIQLPRRKGFGASQLWRLRKRPAEHVGRPFPSLYHLHVSFSRGVRTRACASVNTFETPPCSTVVVRDLAERTLSHRTPLSPTTYWKTPLRRSVTDRGQSSVTRSGTGILISRVKFLYRGIENEYQDQSPKY